ncbi:MAG: toprim domain-containing protein, partial [Candidatus Micrarchaeota archaeon]|nr:toprim domain-containing protein [Candidatus Micrarchaeota archaeon]
MTILVVSEKPSAARKIAAALSNGKARTKGQGKVKYLEFEHGGNTVWVAATVGHVYGIRQKAGVKTYPAFDIEWGPSYEIEKDADYTRDYVKVLRELAKKADEVVNACD